MASIDYNQVTDGAAHPAIGPVQPEASDLLGIARRGWLFILAGTIFGLVCAMVVLSTMAPVYKASFPHRVRKNTAAVHANKQSLQRAYHRRL